MLRTHDEHLKIYDVMLGEVYKGLCVESSSNGAVHINSVTFKPIKGALNLISEGSKDLSFNCAALPTFQ